MSIGVGIGFAFIAMLSWGVGDFLIQRSTRKLGDFETLFLITFFGALLLLPFAYRELPAFLSGSLLTLGVVGLASFALFAAALLNLEAFRRGKLSVVEPIQPLEIVSASALSFLIINERLTFPELYLIAALIVGLILVSYRGRLFSRRFLLERGIWFAIVSATMMGLADFLVGWGTRLSDAILVNFIISSVLAVFSGAFLLARGRLLKSFRDLLKYRLNLAPMIILGNVAWVAYAFAMGLAPIGIVTAFSESAVIIAVILGLSVGREQLELHQKAGLFAAVAAALALAMNVT